MSTNRATNKRITNERITSRRGQYAGIAALIILLGGYGAVQATHLQFFQYKGDEGLILCQSQMLNLGYPLYTAIWTNQPPLLNLLITAAFKLFGQSVATGRIVILAHALITLTAIALLVREIGGDWCGAVGGSAVLALAPGFFAYARAVGRTLPSLAWATLALTVALRYRRHRRRGWLVLAGICMAVSLWIKLITVPALAVIGVTLLFPAAPPPSNSPHRGENKASPPAGGIEGGRSIEFAAPPPSSSPHRGENKASPPAGGTEGGRLRRAVTDGIILALAIGIPTLLGLFAFDARALIEHVILSYLDYSQEIPMEARENLQHALAYFYQHNFFIAMAALVGLLPIHIVKKSAPIRVNLRPLSYPAPERANFRFIALWSAVNLLAVLVNRPLRIHHFLLLLINAAIFAGLGVTKFKKLLTDSALVSQLRGFPYILLVAAALFTLGATRLPHELQLDKELLTEQPDPGVMDAVEMVREMTAPTDFVLTNFPMITFRADRRVPPETCDISLKRIHGGDLTTQDMIRYTETYSPLVAVFWNDRFQELPEYQVWLDQHYKIVQEWAPLQQIRVRNP